MFHILFYLIIQYNQKKTSKNNEKKNESLQIEKRNSYHSKICEQCTKVLQHGSTSTSSPNSGNQLVLRDRLLLAARVRANVSISSFTKHTHRRLLPAVTRSLTLRGMMKMTTQNFLTAVAVVVLTALQLLGRFLGEGVASAQLANHIPQKV